MTLQDAINKVVAFSGVDPTTAQDRVLQRYREMVAMSKWREAIITIAATVAGTDVYAVDDQIVLVDTVRVGGQQYEEVSIEQLWSLQADDGRWDIVGDGGVFAASPTNGAVEQIQLFPVPGTSGDNIDAFVAMLPTIPSGTAWEFAIPQDMHEALVDGAIAVGLKRDDERLDEFQVYEQGFQDTIGKLMRRRKARFSSGPIQIPVIWG